MTNLDAMMAMGRLFFSELADNLSTASVLADGPERDDHIVQAFLNGMRGTRALQAMSVARTDLFERAKTTDAHTNHLLNSAGGAVEGRTEGRPREDT